jgi:hypothetical protein
VAGHSLTGPGRTSVGRCHGHGAARPGSQRRRDGSSDSAGPHYPPSESESEPSDSDGVRLGV